MSSCVYNGNAQKFLKVVKKTINADKNTGKSTREIFNILGKTQETYAKAHCALANRNKFIFKREPAET